MKKTARGFRNAEHFKAAIFFHCGGLDLYHTNSTPTASPPAASTIAGTSFEVRPVPSSR